MSRDHRPTKPATLPPPAAEAWAKGFLGDDELSPKKNKNKKNDDKDKDKNNKRVSSSEQLPAAAKRPRNEGGEAESKFRMLSPVLTDEEIAEDFRKMGVELSPKKPPLTEAERELKKKMDNLYPGSIFINRQNPNR